MFSPPQNAEQNSAALVNFCGYGGEPHFFGGGGANSFPAGHGGGIRWLWGVGSGVRITPANIFDTADVAGEF